MRCLVRLVLLIWLVSGANVSAEIEKVEVDGIVNFSRWVGSTTFAGDMAGFGGQPQPGAMPWLARQGFKTVIALRLKDEEGANIGENRTAAEQAGLTYLHMPFDPEQSSRLEVEEILAVIGDDNIQPVFIHCSSATRAAAIWMIGRVTRDDLGTAAAEQQGSLIAEKPGEAISFVEGYLSALNE